MGRGGSWQKGKKAIQAIRPTFARVKCAEGWNAFIAGIKSLLAHQPSRSAVLHSHTEIGIQNVLVPIVRYICLNLQNVFLTQFIAGINTHFLGLGEKAKVYAISAVDLCCTCYPKSKDQVRHINS